MCVYRLFTAAKLMLLVLTHLFIVADFPPTWESLQQNVKKSSENMQMFEVDQGSQEYADAVKEFEESMNKWGYKFSIEKVQRIENRVEYTKHMALNESFKEKYQKRDVLVMRLFHGSKFASLQLIAVQGFNRNFAADANGKVLSLQY